MVTLVINLYSDNLRRGEENAQLLDFIPSAVILQSIDKAKQSIKFTNRSSKRLHKQMRDLDKEMTWNDTLKTILRKVNFGEVESGLVQGEHEHEQDFTIGEPTSL